MKRQLKNFKPIQNMMVLALLVTSYILTSQASALAQEDAFLPQTGQTQSYASGDDGDLQKGIQWPNPRFTDNEDGTVTDNLTGLIWLRDANCFGGKGWFGAIDDSNYLEDGQCGLSDGSTSGEWRLPNVRELHSLFDYGHNSPALSSGHPFTNVQTNVLTDVYWSSTTVANRTSAACIVSVDIQTEWPNHLLDDVPKEGSGFVWPVRGGNEVELATAPVQKTGQVKSYVTGDDGDLQMGIQWPKPRFTDNEDGTVTDNLTGLAWLKNANCFDEVGWRGALSASNSLEDGQCGLSDGSTSGEWRLPNVRELRSLIDHDNYSPALSSGHPFINVQMEAYWSSTTIANFNESAYVVLMESLGGFVNNRSKGMGCYVWPVRDIQTINDNNGSTGDDSGDGSGSSGPCFVDTLRY